MPSDLYAAAKQIADRDDVKLARVIETALRLYSAEIVSDKMRAFHARVRTEGSALLRAKAKLMKKTA